MIKSLLEADGKQPEEIKIEREEKPAADAAVDENFEAHFAGIESLPSESETLPELSEPADDELIFSEKPPATTTVEPPAETGGEIFDFSESKFDQPENLFAETLTQEPLAKSVNERTDTEPLAGFPLDETNFELPTETAIETPAVEPVAEFANEPASAETAAERAVGTTNYETAAETQTEEPKLGSSGMLFYPTAEPEESFAETARKSGLAYAAAITLFGSIVFMLIIGWFADLLLGSSPWGIVGGILLGAAIGFFQFFRMTAQIFKDRNEQ